MREIVLLKSRNNLFVKQSLHQEMPKNFMRLDPKFIITFCTQLTGSFIHTKLVEQSSYSASLLHVDTNRLHLDSIPNPAFLVGLLKLYQSGVSQISGYRQLQEDSQQ